MPDGSRTRTGCITCRIRKKKCDEQRPVCQACGSRGLTCHGFNAPIPGWCHDKGNWKDARASDEAKTLQRSAETRYKIQRKARSKGTGSNFQELPTLLLQKNERAFQALQAIDSLVPSSVRFPTSGILSASTTNIWQLHPQTIWWDSKIQSLAPGVGSSAHEETRLLMLFLEVIHPITHTFYTLGCSKDRGWMLERLVSTKALHYSALSISACFEYSLTQSLRINDIGICPRVRSLQNLAVRELQPEIDKFALMNNSSIEDFVWAGTRLLDAVVHLKILEIFSMLQGHWEMHHQAARKIINHIELCSTTWNDTLKEQGSVIEAVLSSGTLCDARKRSIEFSISNFIWIDVLAISTFGQRSFHPCAFDYFNLLQSEIIKPQNIMGCQGWIMAAVVRIARLEQWKITNQHQLHTLERNAELTRNDNEIGSELICGIEKLEQKQPHTPINVANEDQRLVSIIWAYGALVLKQVLISNTNSAQPRMDQTYVNLCLEKLEALPTRLIMRTSWPYTIAGCMSCDPSQHARFRGVLTKTLQEAQGPGISWKGLIVMEECRRLQKLKGSRQVDWREAMKSLNARVLLT